MTDQDNRRASRRGARIALSLTILALPLVLAACGSSSSTTTAASTSAASPSARRAQVAACLKKQGVTPPAGRFGGGAPGGPPGGGARRPGGAGGLFGGGGGRPGGAGGSKFRAALSKCGINFGGGRRRSAFTTAAGKRALASFVACVARNGYKLPPPNTSGNGPVFNSSKINRNDPKLLAAASKCQGLLPRRAGQGGGPPGGGGG